MADFKEETIKNYSGLSSETKPTTAAGDTVPNGSRFREVDTGETYYFNYSDDAWYVAHATGAIKLGYSGGNLIYRGLNVLNTAATSATDWRIYKFSYDGSDNLTDIEGPLVGAWDDRASLAWS